MAHILDGNQIRDRILKDCEPRVAALNAARNLPGLAVILVGNDPGSEIYVRNKVKACQALGMYSEKITPPADISTAGLIELVEGLNQRKEIDGILLQLPVPSQIDAKRVLMAIDPDKDVDGLHPLNMGKLVANTPGPRACTPSGVMEMLKRSDIAVAGKRAVVVGRSDLMGKPMALMLMHQNATVTVCHSRTANLPGVCLEADILVAAIGRPAMLTADFIKPGATVIDVGMNRLDDRAEVARIFRNSEAKLAAFDKKGSVLVGDVDPIDMPACSSAYTPVPGGVGPLTIAMLMVNTIESAERRLGACCA